MSCAKILCAAAALCAFALPGPTRAEGRSIIVLDASGSMWGQIDGRPKLEIAREALGTVLSTLPAQTELGLMAYGHREKGSCEDIELIVPPAQGTASAITAAAQSMRFLGKTPLSEAVRRAADDLHSTEEKATVILITDGIETCNADPCALGTELEAAGVDFTAHVVGFGLTEDEGRQVACLAENTGGQYIQAQDAASLVTALETAVAAPAPPPEPAPEPQPTVVEFNLAPKVYLVQGGPEQGQTLGGSLEVYSLDGAAEGAAKMVYQNYGTDPVFLAPGTYRVAYTRDEASAEAEVTLTADGLAAPDLVLDAGIVTLRPVNEAGGDVPSNASITMFVPEGRDYFNYGSDTRVIPSGEYEVQAKIGEATARATVVVTAGETLTQDIIVAAGRALVDVYYTADLRMESSGQRIDIYEAKTDLSGARKAVMGGYGDAQSYTLPPGDYVAVGWHDGVTAEQPFSVAPNQMVTVAVVLNAGVLAISAPGAASIEVFSAKTDISGTRKSVRFEYGDSINATFAAGDYVAVATRDDGLSEGPASVTAGARTEIALP